MESRLANSSQHQQKNTAKQGLYAFGLLRCTRFHMVCRLSLLVDSVKTIQLKRVSHLKILSRVISASRQAAVHWRSRNMEHSTQDSASCRLWNEASHAARYSDSQRVD